MSVQQLPCIMITLAFRISQEGSHERSLGTRGFKGGVDHVQMGRQSPHHAPLVTNRGRYLAFAPSHLQLPDCFTTRARPARSPFLRINGYIVRDVGIVMNGIDC